MAFITAKRIIQNGRVLREWPVQGSPGTRAHGRQGTDLGLVSIQKVLPPGGCFEPALKYKRTVKPSLGGLLPECQLCPGSCPSQGSPCPRGSLSAPSPHQSWCSLVTVCVTWARGCIPGASLEQVNTFQRSYRISLYLQGDISGEIFKQDLPFLGDFLSHKPFSVTLKPLKSSHQPLLVL